MALIWTSPGYYLAQSKIYIIEKKKSGPSPDLKSEITLKVWK